MFYLSVITVHKTYKVALVKCKDIYARTIIQAVYIIGMFYYHHPFGRTLADKIVGKPLLVIAGKLIFRISAELAVIRRIEKYEVILQVYVQGGTSRNQDCIYVWRQACRTTPSTCNTPSFCQNSYRYMKYRRKAH